jgi:hypothetical protein
MFLIAAAFALVGRPLLLVIVVSFLGSVREALSDDDGLDRLSSQELYDLAVSYAKRHLDVRFFWDLMRVLPPAEAAAGELDEAQADVMRLSAHLDDLTDAGRDPIAEMLRPFYIDYLRRHGVTVASQTPSRG